MPAASAIARRADPIVMMPSSLPPFAGAQGSLAQTREPGVKPRQQVRAPAARLKRRTGRKWVSGTPAAWLAGRWVTATVSSNQTLFLRQRTRLKVS